MGKDVVVGHPQHGDSDGAEEGVAGDVMLGRREVMSAVGLDDEASFLAEEVHEVGSERLLSSELGAVDAAAAEQIPEGLFGRCGGPTKSAGPVGRSAEQSRHARWSAWGGPQLRAPWQLVHRASGLRRGLSETWIGAAFDRSGSAGFAVSRKRADGIDPMSQPRAS